MDKKLLLFLFLAGCSAEPYEAPVLDPIELAVCQSLQGEMELVFRHPEPVYKCCFITLCKVGPNCPRFCDDV